MRIRDKASVEEKWRTKVRNRVFRRFVYFVAPVLVYLTFALITWIHAENMRNGFAEFMTDQVGKIIRFFGNAPSDLMTFFERFFNIAYFVMSLSVFILLLLMVLKVRRVRKDRRTDQFSERFKNIGLTNKQGEAPIFSKKMDDPAVIDGKIYIFEDADIDFGRFSDAPVIRGLRNIFCGFVRPDFGDKYGQLRFYVKPSAKIICQPLSVRDTWLVKNMIHCGIFGSTGSGKTYGMAFLLWLYCEYAETENIEMSVHLFDQKLSFAEKLGVSDSASFCYGLSVLEGFEKLLEEFDKIKLAPDGKMRVILIDEYISLVDRLDRKQADRVKSILSTLVFESREYGYHVILAGQAGHSERFGAGARDSLTSKILFGNPSETEKRMLFPDDVGLMDAHNRVGEGYMRIDGMQHVERFSIIDAVPDFAEIGAKLREYMM